MGHNPDAALERLQGHAAGVGLRAMERSLRVKLAKVATPEAELDERVMIGLLFSSLQRALSMIQLEGHIYHTPTN